MLRIVRLAALVALALCGGLSASAQTASSRKVALVIANGGYANATRLANPANDSRLIASALRRANFSTVDARVDLGLASFQTALRDFATRARGADIGLIYYAGHGMEANGQNWLIPVDARLAADTDLEFEAIRLESALRAVEGARTRIVVLDACRDNPFAVAMRRFSPSRAVARGLVGVEADDVLVMYAAAQGQTATDGATSNSPFARALAARLTEPGLELRLMAGKVRDDVLRETSGRQRPFISASITGDALYIVPPPASSQYSATAGESAYWRVCCLHPSAQRQDFEIYLQEVGRGVFPGAFASTARSRLAGMPGGSTATKNNSSQGANTTTITPGARPTLPNGRECRTIRQTFTKDGRETSEDVEFCREPGGAWTPS